MQRTVSADLRFDLGATSDVILSLAVAAATPLFTETLTCLRDGEPVPVTELIDRHGARLHRVRADAGSYVVRYDAVIAADRLPEPLDPVDVIRYLRPSRYAESDRIASFAAQTFGGAQGFELLDRVVDWVSNTLSYVPGSSVGTDSAMSTFASSEGVCRDYAHLTIALLRARDLPARMVSVYAPGLSPMDFHAVVEAYVDGAWYVVDATRLAPRQSLVRIATGRDASDVAFLTNHWTGLTLGDVQVTATAEDLPRDDGWSRVQLG
jgi:transglutaminase-like putative cysteine protease